MRPRNAGSGQRVQLFSETRLAGRVELWEGLAQLQRKMFYDTHCHLDFEVFGDDRAQVVERACSSGVNRYFIPGVAPRCWRDQVAIARQVSGARLGFGVHPFWAHEVSQAELPKVMLELERQLLEQQALAVGECGLDALWARRRGESLEWQLTVFEAQVELACRLQLPLVVHCVRAHGRVLEVLDAVGHLPKGGVLHAYSGSVELVERYRKLGFYFGFGGGVTRPSAKRARRALAHVPIERLVLETDAPDQAPAWVSGRNEPAQISRIAAEVARLRQLPLELLATRTTQNAERLFGDVGE